MKYKSDIFETIHENATANYEVGAISEERMREYNEMCLVKEPETEYIIPKRQLERAIA